ncbi:hypothetical protein ACI65C_012944 [Semiaphis heraclei]
MILLPLETQVKIKNTAKPDTDKPIDDSGSAKVKHCHASILLSTALVKVQNENGEVITVRALLDSASQSSFITESCVYRLGLSREKTKVTVQALSGTQVPVVRGSTTITIRPVHHDSPKLEWSKVVPMKKSVKEYIPLLRRVNHVEDTKSTCPLNQIHRYWGTQETKQHNVYSSSKNGLKNLRN